MRMQEEWVRAALRYVGLVVVLSGLGCFDTQAVWAEEMPSPAAEEDFSLVDERGRSLTDLGVDPDIDPARVGLDSALVVTERNLLDLVLQHAAAMRALWCWYAVVSMGFLLLSVQLARVVPLSAVWGPLVSAGLLLSFGAFAGWHWTAVATVSAQYHLLAAALRHTAAHADAPDMLVALADTLEPVSRATLAAVHVSLDITVLLGLGVIAFGLYRRPDDAT